MNFAYFRKSKHSLETTLTNVRENAEKNGWKVLGETSLPENAGKMILICRPEWVKILLDKDPQLIGFLPCAISVYKNGNDVMIGTGQPSVIKALAQNEEIAQVASIAEQQIQALIHTSAGIEKLKPIHVKLYSTTTCPYCKMEKSWLDEKKITHEMVYVDQNPDEAQKMVEKTGQMGVPVTEIQFKEGQPEFVIGFEQSRLAQILEV